LQGLAGIFDERVERRMNDKAERAFDGAVPVETVPLALGELEKYQLRSKPEIVAVLHSLIKAGSFITAHFNDGKDFLLTTLLSLTPDESSLYLDLGGQASTNVKALNSDRFVCVTVLDKVRIQFPLLGLEQAQLNAKDCFLTRTPATLLRLQRREYYRIPTPIATPLKCRLSVPAEDGTTTMLEAKIVDISLGGMAVTLPLKCAPFEVGGLIEDCHFELPTVGAVTINLRMRSAIEVTLRNGVRLQRWGLQFVDLPAPMTVLIQRYIIHVERDRRVRETTRG
jgi:c-di-GMP-binding flagellar brake protein YcgR